MATEDREVMEVQGAGESCPTFPKMAPDDPMSEGKLRAALVRERLSHCPSLSPQGKREYCRDT